MLEETKYIDEIWDRYNDYMTGNIKNDFYETRVYNKENNMERLLRTVAMFIFTIIATVGVVYAGIAIYNNYIKHSVSSEYSIHVGKDWVKENMKYSEDVKAYYSVITDYQEYLIYKDKFNDMTILKEEDFIDNFVVLVCAHTSRINKIDINDVVEENNMLYINFKINSTNDENKNVSTLLIPREKYNENIQFRMINEKTQEEYTPIEDLSIEYSLNQSINDGCIVLNNGKIVSDNENQIYEFIEKSQKGEDSFIRIVEYNESNVKFRVQDIHYKNKKFIFSIKKDNGKIHYEHSENLKIKLYESDTYRKLILYNNEEFTDGYCIIKF